MLILGGLPLSVHVTVIGPAGIEAPAAGEENWTSAKTKEGARAARRDRSSRRIVPARPAKGGLQSVLRFADPHEGVFNGESGA